MKCPLHCGVEVIKIFHEGTGKNIYLDVTEHKEHICKPKKYWCFECNAGIREDRPCVHRIMKIDSRNRKKTMDYFL